MTMIASIGFLDESYLISDSRISFSGQKDPEDRLIKVFQLAPKLMVAFTSEHVHFTLEVLKRVTEYALQNTDPKKSRFILPHLIRKASYEYNNLLKEYKIKVPVRMEFLYCGVVDKSQMFSSYLLDEIIKRKNGSFRVPEKIGRARMERFEGIWSLSPPCPIIYKQLFPNNPPHPYIHLGYAAGGSGQEVFYELEKEYYNFFDWDLGTTKGIIIENIIDEFIKKNNIPTVGGIVQVWRINKDGITPISYQRKHHTDSTDEGELTRELKFQDGIWTLTDIESGENLKSTKIMTDYFKPKKRAKIAKSSWSNY
jgi:hypothetical protein